jgi:hypothetical protein
MGINARIVRGLGTGLLVNTLIAGASSSYRWAHQ